MSVDHNEWTGRSSGRKMGNVGNAHFKKDMKGTECENTVEKAASSPDLDFIPEMFQSQRVIGEIVAGRCFPSCAWSYFCTGIFLSPLGLNSTVLCPYLIIPLGYAHPDNK